MKIEIWSDVMCPFCYIGKKHFESALEQIDFGDEIEVEWKSFQLDPTLPMDGETTTTRDYLLQKKGMPAQQVDGMMMQLKQSGAQAGIDFQMDRAIPVNTFRAHRFIHYAQNEGKGNEAEEGLFKAHFTDGKNVGDINVLADLAAEIGLNKDEAKAYLQTDDLSMEVKADIHEAQQLGISGVPFFVVDRKYGVSGAQPVQVFVETLKQAYQEAQPKFKMKGDEEAGACGPEGCEI